MGHTPEMNAGRNATFGSITISSSNVKLAGVESTTNLSITGTTSNVTIENNFLNRVFYPWLHPTDFELIF